MLDCVCCQLPVHRRHATASASRCAAAMLRHSPSRAHRRSSVSRRDRSARRPTRLRAARVDAAERCIRYRPHRRCARTLRMRRTRVSTIARCSSDAVAYRARVDDAGATPIVRSTRLAHEPSAVIATSRVGRHGIRCSRRHRVAAAPARGASASSSASRACARAMPVLARSTVAAMHDPRAVPSNERCCSQRHGGTLCNCAALRAAPFTANLLTAFAAERGVSNRPSMPLRFSTVQIASDRR